MADRGRRRRGGSERDVVRHWRRRREVEEEMAIDGGLGEVFLWKETWRWCWPERAMLTWICGPGFWRGGLQLVGCPKH